MISQDRFTKRRLPLGAPSVEVLWSEEWIPRILLLAGLWFSGAGLLIRGVLPWDGNFNPWDLGRFGLGIGVLTLAAIPGKPWSWFKHFRWVLLLGWSFHAGISSWWDPGPLNWAGLMVIPFFGAVFFHLPGGLLGLGLLVFWLWVPDILGFAVQGPLPVEDLSILLVGTVFFAIGWVFSSLIRMARNTFHGQVSYMERVLESLPLPIFFRNTLTGSLIYDNQAFRLYAGIDANSPVQVQDLITLNNPQETLNCHPALEGNFAHADGTPHPVLIFQESIQGPQGPVCLGLLVDMSERKRQMDQMKEAAAAKDLFFALAGHDLRSPAAKIKQFLDVRTDTPELFDEDTWKLLFQDLRRSAGSLCQVLDNLFLWVRNREGGPSPVQNSTFHLEEVWREVQDLLAGQAKDKGVQLSAQGVGLHITSDRTMVHAILRNLINNAIKFTPEGGSVTLETLRTGEQWILRVQDTGVGMPQEKIEKLLKGQGVSSSFGTKNEKGTGFGMTLVVDFLRSLGGEMEITSAPDQGTQIQITFPWDPPGALEEL